MAGLASFGRLMQRRSRFKAYAAQQREMAALTDADLADIGIKRYQLGHAARVRTFK
jgi:uncharacterized protein YjiS (DUF1127 family)